MYSRHVLWAIWISYREWMKQRFSLIPQQLHFYFILPWSNKFHLISFVHGTAFIRNNFNFVSFCRVTANLIQFHSSTAPLSFFDWSKIHLWLILTGNNDEPVSFVNLWRHFHHLFHSCHENFISFFFHDYFDEFSFLSGRNFILSMHSKLGNRT